MTPNLLLRRHAGGVHRVFGSAAASVHLACLLVALASGTVRAQQGARPTVMVPDLEHEDRWPYQRTLAGVAASVTRELTIALSRDTAVQLLPRDVNARPLMPGSGKPSAVNHFVGGTVKESPPGIVKVHWVLLRISDAMVMIRDSLEIVAGREREVADVIARRVSATLAPVRSTP